MYTMNGMTTTEAAKLTGRTLDTIRHWCRYGAVAAAKVAGRWVIDTASLNRRIALGVRPAKVTAPRFWPAAAPAPKPLPRVGYRKTKSGEWVVYGPADLVHVGPVAVTKRDGSVKIETVVRVGKDFIADGRIMRYGYLAEAAAPQDSRSTSTCDECGGHGARYPRSDSSGIGGMVCARCSRQPSYMLSFA